MANIKTRDITRGTIKTLNRTSSYTHRMKDHVIRSKIAEVGNTRNNEESNSYASETVEHYAGSGSAYAAQAGVELLMNNRSGSLRSASEPVQTEEHVCQAFREYGAKTIQGRKQSAAMADREVVQRAEEFGNNDRIVKDASLKAGNRIRNGRSNIADNRRKLPKPSDNAQRSRKEHAIKRILSRQEARRQRLLSLFRPGSLNKGRRRASTASRFMRFVWERLRSALIAAGISGTAIVIILVLFVVFGMAVITLSNNSPETRVSADNQEEIVYFIPDLAGSPTRIAIVRAAEKEIGNVGGEKFWRWYGFSYHVHWCACFTSYIAAECGCIKAGICPRSAGVDDWIDFYKEQHRWAGNKYIPHSGDFIIFEWDGDGVADHIGIVESCDGKTVTTIEGNSRDICRRKTYPVGHWQIYGYGLPAYSSMGTH
ncbi:MAG: CHAP domain-containing protein [Oscillospiraceae bacterium]|nr:CHAP domain-containing protein [Oscillospiraceae bacterium]